MSDTTDDMEYLSGSLEDDNDDNTVYECPYCKGTDVKYDNLEEELYCFNCKKYLNED